MKKNNRLALVVAYYLSRFDSAALEALGYRTFKAAFEDIGKILQVKPNTVKNMRDEFDPFHDNSRAGWYQSKARPSRSQVLQQFQDVSEEGLKTIVQSILSVGATKHEFLESISYEQDLSSDDAVSENKHEYFPRGPTGRMAEEFFLSWFSTHSKPIAGQINDARDLGAGYDFEIHGEGTTVYVEVKGLAEAEGSILFTDKEWEVAQKKKIFYYLFLVSNISTAPQVRMIQDSASKVAPTVRIYRPVQVSWTLHSRSIPSSGADFD